MSESKTSSHLIGGFLGGLTSSVILQPFDLIKTRLQQHPDTTLRTTLKQFHSLRQLWRGTLPSALRTSVGSALFLSSLNVVRTTIAKSKTIELTSSVQNYSSNLPKLSMTENLLTGSITRGFVGWLTMPITIIKVRYESTLYSYNSIWEATTSIFRKEGIKGFFNGFSATAARDAPYAGLYVLLYEQSKSILPTFFKEDRSSSKEFYSTFTSSIINSTSAFTAASLATTITAPFDTIKTRMQLQPTKFKSFFQTFSLIVKKEGVLNLFDGLSLRLSRKALSAGIAWGIYEEIIKYVTKS